MLKYGTCVLLVLLRLYHKGHLSRFLSPAHKLVSRFSICRVFLFCFFKEIVGLTYAASALPVTVWV